jgi:hypothetical protein
MSLIPDLLLNLDTDNTDPLTFDEVLIPATALYLYRVSDTAIIAHCCQTEREYPWNVQKSLALWILLYSITSKQRDAAAAAATAVMPFSNNTRHDLRILTNASGKPLNSPRRLFLCYWAFFTK